MVRGLSLVSLLVTLLVVGWMLTAQHSGSNDTKTSAEIEQAQQSASGVAFQQAQTELESFHALNGTYAGASLGGFGVTLVRADASTYCIQDTASHLDGPGGAPAAGPC
jgi:predicted negative regulator of RcsB-dependent stress response